MSYLVFVVAAAVAVFAVLVGMAVKAGSEAAQCGDLDGPESKEEDEDDEPCPAEDDL